MGRLILDRSAVIALERGGTDKFLLDDADVAISAVTAPGCSSALSSPTHNITSNASNQ